MELLWSCFLCVCCVGLWFIFPPQHLWVQRALILMISQRSWERIEKEIQSSRKYPTSWGGLKGKPFVSVSVYYTLNCHTSTSPTCWHSLLLLSLYDWSVLAVQYMTEQFLWNACQMHANQCLHWMCSNFVLPQAKHWQTKSREKKTSCVM